MFAQDLTKPLVFQVGHLGEDYEEGVHQPTAAEEGGPRYFQSGVLEVEESDEARKKFPNAKSISSAQFFEDQNKSADLESNTIQSILDKFLVRLTPFSSLVDIAGKIKKNIFKTVTSIIYRDLLNRTVPPDLDELRAIRRDLNELMQKLDGKDAKAAIPLDTRFKWVDQMRLRAADATADVNPAGNAQPVAMMFAIRNDAFKLYRDIANEKRARDRKKDHIK